MCLHISFFAIYRWHILKFFPIVTISPITYDSKFHLSLFTILPMILMKIRAYIQKFHIFACWISGNPISRCFTRKVNVKYFICDFWPGFPLLDLLKQVIKTLLAILFTVSILISEDKKMAEELKKYPFFWEDLSMEDTKGMYIPYFLK